MVDDEASCRLLQRKFIVYVLHSGRRENILAATPCLRSRKFLFISPQSRDPRIAFALDLREDLIEPRILGRKKRTDD
jgi:hypothetical protein